MLKNRLKHNIACSTCLANYLCLPKNLEDVVISELDAQVKNFKMVEKGEQIFHAEDPMHHLYAVYTGCCKDYWLDVNGNQRIDNFYFPGDIIGLESIAIRKHYFSLVALEDTQLCVIPLEDLFELMKKHDTLLKRVIDITSFKMQNDKYISITTNAHQRVADFILNILYRLEERKHFQDHISLPMSQLDISCFLGMAHETVNRILRQFHKEKIININNKKIYITNIDRLKELGTSLIHFGQDNC